MFHIFWMHDLKKIQSWSLFFLFEISSNFDWNLSNLNFLVFCRNFFQNVDFESKNIKNEACDFDDEHIFRKLRCNSIKRYTFGCAFDPERLYIADLFFRSLLNMKKKLVFVLCSTNSWHVNLVNFTVFFNDLHYKCYTTNSYLEFLSFLLF